MASTPRQLVELGLTPELAKRLTSATAAAANITPLTDNSGGTASNTIADVPASYTEATLANQIASLTAKINDVIAALKA